MSPRRGFTLLELTIVLTLSALTLGFAGVAFGRYFSRTSARRAAQIFVQDLTQARLFALRSREPVVIRFFEGSMRYEIAGLDSGTDVTRRRFGDDGDIDLSAVTLDIDGDSVVFDLHGVADLSDASGSLGTATFASGASSYVVSFNSMGASKVEGS
jgi:prepilin-type N-terminal cleavage/methylation domain-containing protein